MCPNSQATFSACCTPMVYGNTNEYNIITHLLTYRVGKEKGIISKLGPKGNALEKKIEALTLLTILLATWKSLSMSTALGTYGYCLHAHQNAAKVAVLPLAIEKGLLWYLRSSYATTIEVHYKLREPFFLRVYALI